MKFAIKLSALLSAIIIVFGLIISLFVYQSNLSILKEIEIHHLQDVAYNTLNKIDRNFFERYSDIKGLADDSVISSRNSTAKEIAERLVDFRNTYKTYVSLSFFDTNRIRIADTSGIGIGKQNELELYFKEALQGKISAASDVKMSSTLNQPIIYFASPVKDEKGEIFGVVVTRVPITKLYEITKEAAGIHEEMGELMVDLVDKDGLLFYSNHNKKGILKDNLTEWDSFQRSRAGEKIGSDVHADPGEEEMIYVFIREQGYLDFKGNDWTLIIHVPTRVAFAPAVELRNVTIIILLLLIAPALLISFLFSKTITNPITKLRDATTKIGKGEYGHRIKIKTGDEIETLSDAFNTLSLNLKKSQEELQNYSINLEKKVKLRTKELDRKIKESEESRIATLNILEDVNETREKLEKAYAELKTLDVMKGDFMNIAAHELKTPLIPIIGYVDLLTKEYLGKLNEEQKKILGTIMKNSIRLQKLIQDVLDITKLESRVMKFEMKNIQIKDVIKDSVKNMKLFAIEKNLDLSYDVENDLPLIRGDKNRLSQVFGDLIDNAIKFTDAGSINITAKRNANRILVSVKDTGIGIDKNFMPKIFQKFQQADTTAKRKYSGTGLGLAICKEIIEHHDGKIWVESKPGNGSKFIFSLPVK